MRSIGAVVVYPRLDKRQCEVTVKGLHYRYLREVKKSDVSDPQMIIRVGILHFET